MVFESCALVEGQGFGGLGSCIGEAFFGDPILTTIGMLGIFAYFAYKMNLPHEVSVMMGVGLVFVMAMVSNNAAMYPVVALAVIVLSVYFVRGILKPAKR